MHIKVCNNEVYKDRRGYFTVNYQSSSYFKNVNFIQDNESYSKKNVFRGMHFQKYPFSQSKLIRVVYGKIIDFIMDVRPASKHFKKLHVFELDSSKKKSIFIPKGYAHGFLVLSDFAIFQYKVDNKFSHKHSFGFNIFENLSKLGYQKSKLILSKTDKFYSEIDKVDHKNLIF